MKLTGNEKKLLQAVASIDGSREMFTYARIRELTALPSDEVKAIEAGLIRRGLLQARPAVTNAGLTAIGEA